MTIDPLDLLPLTFADFKVGGYFYILKDGYYLMAKVTLEDIKTPEGRFNYLAWVRSLEGRMFVNRNAPYSAMNGKQPDWEVKLVSR